MSAHIAGTGSVGNRIARSRNGTKRIRKWKKGAGRLLELALVLVEDLEEDACGSGAKTRAITVWQTDLFLFLNPQERSLCFADFNVQLPMHFQMNPTTLIFLL